MFTNILIPALAVGATGLAFGALLGFASIVFKVDKDERIDQINELLPGANCGGCGYAGCAALAEAIVTNGEAATKCNLMTAEKNELICEIMGVKAGDVQKRTARLKCAGTCDACGNKYDFTGINDCYTAMQLNGGPKSCDFGCMGLGSCVAACEFDAITIENGIAHIDSEKCTGCARCQAACPKNLIELVDVVHPIYVSCSSTDKGAVVKNYCSSGCIGCKICEKKCEADAIHVENNLAKIDYEKCTACGACVEACPKKIIHSI